MPRQTQRDVRLRPLGPEQPGAVLRARPIRRKALLLRGRGGRFRFASEIKALLLDQDVSRRANDARVLDFLARAISDHTEETMFEGIYQLPAGSYMRVSSARGLMTLGVVSTPTG